MARGYTHSGGETYRESDTVGALTQQSASETSAMTPLIAAPLSHGSNPNSNMAGRRREDDENLVAFHPTGGGAKGLSVGELAPGVGVGNAGSVAIAGTLREHVRPGSNTDASVVQGASVRRLTPVECERLQALPDGWTNPPGDAADSRRYAGLGDAVTASVAEWIGRRIKAAA